MLLDIRLGKAGDVPVKLHWSWIPFLALSTWLLAAHTLPESYPDRYASWYWLAAATIGAGGVISVLAHEVSHLAVALRYRQPLLRVVLFPFGGVAQFTETPHARHALLYTVSGPVGSALVALLFATAGQLLAEPALLLLALFNAGVALVNWIPADPLDAAGLVRSLGSSSGRLRPLHSALFWLGLGISAILMWSGALTVFLGHYLVDGLLFIVIGLMLQIANDIPRVVPRQPAGGPLGDLSVADFASSRSPGSFATGRPGPTGHSPLASYRPDAEMTVVSGSDGAFLNVAPPASLARWTVPVDGKLNAALEKMDRYALPSLLIVDGHRIVRACTREEILAYVQRAAGGHKSHTI